MAWIDWLLLAISACLVIACAAYTRRYVRSVADFVAGGRAAGRYLICNAKGEAGSGVANTLSKFQVILVSGFVLSWWDSVSMAVLLLVAMNGFVVYRYRQTRAMTVGQFFEMRYSRRFRLFAGGLVFVAGLLNYGIFPAIGSKFFVYFLDLPLESHFLGLRLPTYVILMAAYLAATLWMMLVGGQVTLMVTDCIEGILSHAVYIVLIATVFMTISWSQMRATLADTAPGHSLFNPFDAMATKDFNLWFALMTLVLNIYASMAWQNGHGFNSSARTAHESRMGNMLGNWRMYARQVMVVVLALAAMTYLHHPDFAGTTVPLHRAIDSIADGQVRTQMTVPLALRYLLPAGVKGLFCTIMLLGLIAGDAAHMLSWGGIFIQDVILPLRQTPLSPQHHVRILRWAVAGVATFAFFFSIVFRQTQYIVLWWAITMGVFTAGAGIAIIGGLYWRKGTTAGAWAAIICGATLSLLGISAPLVVNHFPLNGTQVAIISAAVSSFTYIAVSLATCRHDFNMDRLLHRGVYAVADDHPQAERQVRKRLSFSTLLGFNEDYTKLDRIVCGGVFVWAAFWLLVVLVGTVWNLLRPWPTRVWAHYWLIVGIILPLVIAVVTLVWFGIGGILDLRSFFQRLASLRRDASDDGTVTEPAPEAEAVAT